MTPNAKTLLEKPGVTVKRRSKSGTTGKIMFSNITCQISRRWGQAYCKTYHKQPSLCLLSWRYS